MKRFAVIAAATSCLLAPPAFAHGRDSHCATGEESQRVRTYYEKFRPGVPLPVPSRFLNVPEMVIASGLPSTQSVGVAASPEITKQVWKSIDAWGAETSVKLVFSPGGKHAFAFPSLVPITQTDDGSGMLDVYADDGKGVHSHIQLAYVKTIYATDVPTKEEGKRTRGISFFGPDGQLIIGVYASITSDTPDPKALAGYAKTWELLKTLPPACSK